MLASSQKNDSLKNVWTGWGGASFSLALVLPISSVDSSRVTSGTDLLMADLKNSSTA